MGKRRLLDAIYQWLSDYKKNSVKPATYDRLVASAVLMDKYPIANIFEDELTCDDIQCYINQLNRDGYSLSTIKKQFTLLTGYLKHAYSQGYVRNLIYLGAELPKQANTYKPKKAVEAYSELDEAKLKSVLKTLDHPTYAIGILMLEAGLRVGEAQCITWSDISWDRQALRINKTHVRLSMQHGLRFVQNSPKSVSSNRLIPLSPLAMGTLKRLHDTTLYPSGLIFADEKDPSLPYTYETIRYHLRIACEKANVKYLGTHVLRHTFATDCFHRDPSNVKSLSKMLGHADTALTYNTYVHLYEDGLEEMRKVIV